MMQQQRFPKTTRARLIVILLAGGLISGCTSPNTGQSFKPSASAATTSTSQLSRPASAQPATPSRPAEPSAAVAPTGRPAIDPVQQADVVICRPQPETPSNEGGTGLAFTISRLSPGSDHEEVLLRSSITDALTGWTWVDSGQWASATRSTQCGTPTSWAPDFTKFLITGIPPGKTTRHLAILDLTSPDATLTDLTEQRQGKAFNDPVLNVTAAGFLSDAPSDKVIFGHNIIAFEENDEWKQIDLRGAVTEVSDAVFEGHAEAAFIGAAPSGEYREISPDGSYIALGPYYAASFYPATKTSDDAVMPECPGMSSATFLGWADATHAVIGSEKAGQAGLVTMGATLTCELLLPPTEKTLKNFRLTHDGQKLLFEAAGPEGNETYSVPTTLPATEPIQAEDTKSITAAVIFYPGNY